MKTNAAQNTLFDYVAHIPRASIPGIRDMHVDGKTRDLGVVKNYRNHAYLLHHMPKNVSVSWTHLGEGQTLEPHVHPVASMIIVTRGQGYSIGDSHVSFKSGDVIYIPEHNSHGFVGAGEEGFWALSIQFEETAIFENEIDPLTQYLTEKDRPLAAPIQVIRRSSLDSIREIEIDGKTHHLGLVKNFRTNKLLQNFLPQNLSLAWVRLTPGEQLHTHQHAEDSMIIITEGHGRFQGVRGHDLAEGDIVYVPEHHLHGFSGAGQDGFWGLSVQFSPASLYEKPETPRVVFVPEKPSFEGILAKNDVYAERFVEHRIFECIKNNTLDDKDTRNRFLAALTVWSGYFQRIVFARSAFTNPGHFSDFFAHHLEEELGHDKDLEATHNTSIQFDAGLEGMSAWFIYQTLALDNMERTVMTNLVLERAGREFYTRYSSYLRQFGVDQHFEEHVEHDESHETMGLEYLHGLTEEHYTRLESIQQKSWQMLEGILDRVVSIALQEDTSKTVNA